MPRRFPVPGWPAALAGACGLAVVLVGSDLGWGFGTSLLLGLVLAAVVLAVLRVRSGPPRTRAGGPPPRPPALPPLKKGHAVVTLRELGGGGLGEVVPRGSRGVVAGLGWGKVEVTVVVRGALGDRQVTVAGQREDFHRIT